MEVKLPTFRQEEDASMNNEHVHGQVFDYLTMLKAYYCVQQPFCILTTYRQWKVYWLDGMDDIATQEKTENKVPQPAVAHPLLVSVTHTKTTNLALPSTESLVTNHVQLLAHILRTKLHTIQIANTKALRLHIATFLRALSCPPIGIFLKIKQSRVLQPI